MLRVQLLMICTGYTPPGTTRTRSQGGSRILVSRNTKLGTNWSTKTWQRPVVSLCRNEGTHTHISERFP